MTPPPIVARRHVWSLVARCHQSRVNERNDCRPPTMGDCSFCCCVRGHAAAVVELHHSIFLSATFERAMIVDGGPPSLYAFLDFNCRSGFSAETFQSASWVVVSFAAVFVAAAVVIGNEIAARPQLNELDSSRRRRRSLPMHAVCDRRRGWPSGLIGNSCRLLT